VPFEIKDGLLYHQKIIFVGMDTRFLESFVAVVEAGSVAEAARRLNLTPAGVAQRIRALETEMGSPLISRSGRAMRLTEGGAAILDHARDLLKEVRDLKIIAANDKPMGELRLGTFHTASTGILPNILRLLSRTYPSIDVYIVRHVSSDLYQQVLDGRIDAAIVAEPPFAIPKVLEWRKLREEPLILLAPRSISSRDPHAILASEPYIALDHNVWAGRLVDAYLRQARIRPRERFELDALETIAIMVDRGLGVSVVPDWAPPWPEGLSLAKFALPANRFARRIGLIWNRASVRLRLVHFFLEQALVAINAVPAVAPKPRCGSRRQRIGARKP
jgi:DNA-binding transcriptional LysR family regulator